MTGKLILMKARQSRIEALKSLEGLPRGRRARLDAGVFRSSRKSDSIFTITKTFHAPEEPRRAA